MLLTLIITIEIIFNNLIINIIILKLKDFLNTNFTNFHQKKKLKNEKKNVIF